MIALDLDVAVLNRATAAAFVLERGKKISDLFWVIGQSTHDGNTLAPLPLFNGQLERLLFRVN